MRIKQNGKLRINKVLCAVLAFLLTALFMSIISSTFASGEGTEGTDTPYEAAGSSIGGSLWLDIYNDTSAGIAYGDGIRQDAEQPLTGYPVSLYTADDTSSPVREASTSAYGEYEFTGLEPGSYVVGVKTETMGCVEYLLPFWHLNGTTGDNRFMATLDEEADAYLFAYTAPIEIGEDTIVTGMDAGMRTPPGVQPVNLTGGYTVKNNNTGTAIGGTYNRLDLAVTACVTTAPCTITISGTDPDMSINYTTGVVTIPANKNITLTGGGIINQKSTTRHLIVNGTLTLQNITLDGNSVGGGVQVNAGGTLNMNDGATIQNCLASNSTTTYGFGGGVRVDGGIFNMSGGTISKNKAGVYSGTGSRGDAGGGVCVRSGTFNMTDGTISGNVASSGTGPVAFGGGVAIYTDTNGEFNMSGGIIENNQATTSNKGEGGGVYVTCGTFDMDGGTIRGNQATTGTGTGWGGGVLVMEGATFTMEDGIISGNQATIGDGYGYGGGVYVYGGTFKMDDGTISENQATTGSNMGNGGGVYMGGGGTFKMDGGTISGNQATTGNGGSYGGYGGGVYVGAAVFTMGGGEGTPLIKNNKGMTGTGTGTGGGVYMGDDTAQFNMDDGTISGNQATTGAGTGLGGGVYMSRGTFTMAAGTISENQATTGAGTGYGGGVYMSRGTFTMAAGTISENQAKTSAATGTKYGYGGGVYMGSGTFTMGSGTGTPLIENNQATTGTGTGAKYGYGGGVYVSGSTSKFTMGGGTGSPQISGNQATTGTGTGTGYGGGVYVNNGAEFTMNAGTGSPQISGNQATTGTDVGTGDGGGVYVNSSTFTMNAGTISGNTTAENTTGSGGGVYVNTSAKFEATSAGIKITNNKAPKGDGGGVFTKKAYDAGHKTNAGYADVTISAAVTFSGNESQKLWPYTRDTPLATTIVTAATVSPAYAGYSSLITHPLYPLNNDDVNYSMQYKVTYNNQNAGTEQTNIHTTGLMDPLTEYTVLGQGGPFTTPVIPPTSTGSVFLGWDTQLVGKGTRYYSGETIYMVGDTEEIVLYAQWGVNLSTEFKFTKVTSEDTKAALPGAEFALYYWDGEAADTLPPVEESTIVAGKWVLVETEDPVESDAEGQVLFEDLTSMVYQLVETKAPDGYITPVGQWRITYDEENDKWNMPVGMGEKKPPEFFTLTDGSLAVANAKEFEFTKVTSEDTKTHLPGAKFALYYWAGTDPVPDTVEDSQIGSTGWVSVSVVAVTSKENGKVLFENLTRTVYYLVETEAPAGYIKPVGQWKVTFNENTVKWGGDVVERNGEKPPEFFTLADGSLAVVNTKEFKFTKVTSDDMETPLPGAEFALYYWAGDEDDMPETVVNFQISPSEWISLGTVESGQAGQVLFKNLTGTVYQLVETEAPGDYIRPAGQWRITFDKDEGEWKIAGVAEDGEETPPTFFTLDNDGGLAVANTKAVTSTKEFKFIKVNAEDTGEPLPGAEFELYYWAGDAGDIPGIVEDATIGDGKWVRVGTVDPVVSDENGKVLFEGLTKNVYQLVETKAPPGYIRPVGQWRITYNNTKKEWEVPEAKGSILPPAFLTLPDGSLAMANVKNKFFPFSGFGGIGAYLITGMCVMVFSFVFFLFSRKRKVNINKLILAKGGRGRKS